MEKIKVGIAGYGNIGRGVEKAVNAAPDMELKAFFTRRDPAALQTNTLDAKILRTEDAASMRDDLDIVILCGGPQPIYPSKVLPSPAFSIQSTALTPMQKSPIILQQWTAPPKIKYPYFP